MKKNILVSVIIPMYNVEKFIEKCISSVIKQTYKNIEIILIDDGSPDNSGYIAEKLAKLDSRIFVTRTENNGVSSARNLGIRLSTGKYLVFVDGDDYLAPDYIDYMMTLALNSGAEFVMSRNCRLFPGDDSKDNDFIDNITVWSPEKAATELLYPGRIEIGCWNKFFLRDFIIKNNITFPEKFYMGEGLSFIIDAAQKANKICVGSRKVYHYRKNNLQSATTVVNIPKYINALRALRNIQHNLIVDSKALRLSMLYHEYITTYLALHTIYVTNEKEKYSFEINQYISFLRKNYFLFMVGEFKLSFKIKLALFVLNPFIAVKIISVIKEIGSKRV